MKKLLKTFVLMLLVIPVAMVMTACGRNRNNNDNDISIHFGTYELEMIRVIEDIGPSQTVTEIFKEDIVGSFQTVNINGHFVGNVFPVMRLTRDGLFLGTATTNYGVADFEIKGNVLIQINSVGNGIFYVIDNGRLSLRIATNGGVMLLDYVKQGITNTQTPLQNFYGNWSIEKLLVIENQTIRELNETELKAIAELYFLHDAFDINTEFRNNGRMITTSPRDGNNLDTTFEIIGNSVIANVPTGPNGYVLVGNRIFSSTLLIGDLSLLMVLTRV